jgi:esterase
MWRSFVVDSDGTQLAARETGRARGPTVVFLHGLGAHQAMWDRVAASLVGRYRLITYDLRGHGRSTQAERYDVQCLLDDLDRVLATCGTARGTFLVGHSLGADLVLIHVGTGSDAAGAVLVDGAIPVALAEPDWERFAAMERGRLFRILSFVGKRRGTAPSLGVRDMKVMIEDIEQRRRRYDGWLEGAACPVMYVVGNRADRVPSGKEIFRKKIAAVERARNRHPNLAVELLDCGHFVPLKRPRELARLIAKFVDRHGGELAAGA